MAEPPRRADVALTVDRAGNGFGETLVVTVTQVVGVPSGWLHLTVRSAGAVYLDSTTAFGDLTAPVPREWCLLGGPAEDVGVTAVFTAEDGVEVGRAFLALARRDGEIVTAPSLAELPGTASPGGPG
jgi:hypothetical protein